VKNFFTAVHKKFENQERDFFLDMNMTDHKFHVYNQAGQLTSRYDYSHIVKVHGEPYATSNNGQVFIFKEKKDDMKLQIYVNTLLKFVHIKEIRIDEQINKYVSDMIESNDDKYN